jgi:hypothetical protein
MGPEKLSSIVLLSCTAASTDVALVFQQGEPHVQILASIL